MYYALPFEKFFLQGEIERKPSQESVGYIEVIIKQVAFLLISKKYV